MAAGGGAAGRRRQKDQEMAARLKADNVRRTSQRCPTCYAIVGLGGSYYGHVSTICRGGGPQDYEDAA